MIEVAAGQREISIVISFGHYNRDLLYCHVNLLVNISGGIINVANVQTQRESFAVTDAKGVVSALGIEA